MPTENQPNPPLYKLRIFAPDHVTAKSRYWYYVTSLKKMKKTQGEIVSLQEVSLIPVIYTKDTIHGNPTMSPNRSIFFMILNVSLFSLFCVYHTCNAHESLLEIKS